MAYRLNYAHIGRRLAQQRRDMGFTQRELAQRVHVSTSLVGHVERGEKIPSVDTLAALCEALEISMDYLVLGKRAVACEQDACPLYEDLKELLGRYGR